MNLMSQYMAAAISIHALLAESDDAQMQTYTMPTISIHALLAESDYGKLPKPLTDCVFLSTLSLRRATKAKTALYRSMSISIHALLAESDRYLCCNGGDQSYFYPRSPCGERHDFCRSAL